MKPTDIYQHDGDPDHWFWRDPEGNEQDVTRVPFWWKCANGHEWQDSISNRTKGATCPVCKT